jgi:hypothetical protein
MANLITGNPLEEIERRDFGIIKVNFVSYSS